MLGIMECTRRDVGVLDSIGTGDRAEKIVQCDFICMLSCTCDSRAARAPRSSCDALPQSQFLAKGWIVSVLLDPPLQIASCGY